MQHSIDIIKNSLPIKVKVELPKGLAFQCNFEWLHKPLKTVIWEDIFDNVNYGEYYELGFVDYYGRLDTLAISPSDDQIVGISDDCDETDLMLYGSSASSLCKIITAIKAIGDNKEEICESHHALLSTLDPKYSDTVWRGLIRHLIEDY